MFEPMQRKIYSQHHWILEKLEELQPKTLLEVGCGFGRNIKFIAENYPFKLKITGVDFSDSMLKSARSFLSSTKRASVSIELLRENILSLPFGNSSFDAVLCHGALMHIKPQDIKKATSELKRVTKKWLFLIEQNDASAPLAGKPFRKINYYTFTYPYKKLFRAKNAKILEYKRKGQLDWFLMSFNSRKAKSPVLHR